MAETKTVKTTARGKEYRTRVADQSPLFEVYLYPGGQMPKELKGLYTSEGEARAAIDAYQRKKVK